VRCSALVRRAAGLAWASEWGPGWQGTVDVDSGPVVDASPSSSGFAIGAARAIGDDVTCRALTRSLRAADVVVAWDPQLRLPADNRVSDVVVWRGLIFGPLRAAIGPVPASPAGSARSGRRQPARHPPPARVRPASVSPARVSDMWARASGIV
jgi:hypothetical protein